MFPLETLLWTITFVPSVAFVEYADALLHAMLAAVCLGALSPSTGVAGLLPSFANSALYCSEAPCEYATLNVVAPMSLTLVMLPLAVGRTAITFTVHVAVALP